MTTKLQLPDSEVEALKAIIRDDLRYISLMQVPSKQAGGPRVSFNPWPAQLKLLNRMTHRDLVLKDSQIGCTSLVTALFAKRTLTTPDTTTVIVAHEGFLTERLLSRTQLFINSIPQGMRPEQDHSSTKEMTFPDINSTIYIGTARAQVFGRGEPIQNLLFSEEGFYLPEAWTKIMYPAIQRVPETGHVVRESTPNGEDGSLYEEVQKALRGQSVYRLHLLFWWENPDNVLYADSPLLEDLAGRFEEVGNFTSEEVVGAREYGWTEAQIRWRRYHLHESGVMFFQEHLEDLATCFLTIGQPYYDPNLTVALSGQTFKAPHAGPEGAMVWYLPETGGYYTMGIDPGQGKQTESVAQVWRWDLEKGPRHEATLAGFIEPDAMAVKCMALNDFYGGSCLLVPEANSHGMGLIARLRERRLRIYMRTNLANHRTGTEVGWYTSSKTKPFMMQEMKIRLGDIITHDEEFVRQLRGFRELGEDKIGTTAADDYHDAGCLAIVGGISYNPKRRRGYIGRSGWNW